MSHNWYVLYVRPKYERKIQDELTRKGIESYLPLVETIRNWHDRKKKLLLPVFPNYIFVKLLPYRLQDMFFIPGFVRVVSKGDQAETLSEKQIDHLKVIFSGDYEVLAEEISNGDSVRITTGALAGLKGVLVERKGRSYFVISVLPLGQYIQVNVDDNYIEKCELSNTF